MEPSTFGRRALGCTVREVFVETFKCLGRDLSKDGIELVQDLDPAVIATMRFTALQHVLLNLVLNSRRAMLGAEQGRRAGTRRELKVWAAIEPASSIVESSLGDKWRAFDTRTLFNHAKHFTISGNSGPVVVIGIADTGCGMSPEQLSRLFTPFAASREKLSPSELRHPEDDRGGSGERRRSTGLGMTVCRRLVEDAGGWLVVNSAQWQGTRIQLVFPSRQNAAH